MKNPVIFDLDGTLIDSLPGIASSLNRSLSALGLPEHPLPSVRGFIGNGARTLIERAAPRSTSPALLEILEARFKSDYDATWPSGTSVFPRITPLLASLEATGIPLAVLSNKPHPFTLSIVRSLFPTVRFDLILGHQPGTPLKPDPASALGIAASLNLPAAAFTLIGDSTVDLETARRAGMSAIAVSWGYHDAAALLAAGARSVCDSPDQLLPMLLPPPATGSILPQQLP